MNPADTARAADADREAVAERLRIAAGEGRIDLEELDERLGLAYGAKTYGQLRALVADLPIMRAPRGHRRGGDPDRVDPVDTSGRLGGPDRPVKHEHLAYQQ